MPSTMTVAEALMRAEQIDRSLDAWAETAPEVVASVGGREGLARRCQMTCIGPVPRLDVETWARASREREDRRLAAAGSQYYGDEPGASIAHTLPPMPSAEEVGEPARRVWWHVWR